MAKKQSPAAQSPKLIYRDCLRDCLRILLNNDSPPTFEAPTEYEFWVAVQKWLAATYDSFLLDIPFLEVPLSETLETGGQTSSVFPWYMPVESEALFILAGKTTNGITHAVIGHMKENTLTPFYDPIIRVTGEAAPMRKWERAMFIVRRARVGCVKAWHHELRKFAVDGGHLS